ncbi:bifunctional folylpolyglutamate synthase/dihydrofolate synthase [Roseospira marina]|uniref:Dihydrofolate synthase/folylpolyglutamate synthase n=1 Tax=Roseospira marina TaxID=140057 RepID=A0A5M6IIA0_9PROT|nr:folylpolyglutamate synthase/dihydrofolate synthase family protein [Roseospira marina]KAA5607667.1 bifunctional folylpolyglutamate synthase/dihydrofolate synthase [Roseospira marina]MBB4312618.1 dihydrofolate synthase/folylpolyglutamate synthase [Roseospira marina]MBB5085366.1 dihydrofolate synthase/folylpolyglutamate synthase [Roseospira marina]
MAPASDQVLARLMTLHPKVIDLVLDRVWRLLARLDHPERRLPPVVHVAGTNGKGSVLALLRAMLEASGLRVHAYTSPHLVRFAERVRLAGSLIEEDRLTALLKTCEAANGADPITFFEITTCAAFLAFAEEPADIVLLETGLGGRLDATNVIDRPILTGLTPIALDHQSYLGDTLAAIAFEKAGILKAGVPCVSAAQQPDAARVIAARAAEFQVSLFLGARDWSWSPASNKGLRLDDGALWPAPERLTGDHQRANAALAIRMAQSLPPALRPDEDAIRAGLTQATWPARLQALPRGPLVRRLPDGWEVWLDGGHNPHAGDALAEVLAHWPPRPLHLIVGMLDTKDTVGFLRPLVSRARTVHVVPIPETAAALSTDTLAVRAREAGAASVREHPNVGDALDAVATGGDGPGRVLICGSLYLAGSVLAENGPSPT